MLAQSFHESLIIRFLSLLYVSRTLLTGSRVTPRACYGGAERQRRKLPQGLRT
ncbi:hypothetical protein [Mastigocladopsis repens]|uniref:hypothetical protein n=1 Tax=Mastigocladopsis repens TaxID=221287 RepID=UPI001E548524|nr:hypothetical protein [Mastigocladopsis repens]